MGKKSDTAKPATAIAESPASTTAATRPAAETAAPAPKVAAAAKPGAPAKPAAARPPAADGNGARAKAAVKKKAVKKVPKKTTVIFSTEDIALRAYFIAEHRHRHGLAGDSHSDWIEAERQLKKEAAKKTAKKKPQLKKRA
jgi:hypothetical protein